MSLILNIDTASPEAFISLSENGKVLKTSFSKEQREHASFLHPAIKEILDGENRNINDLDAIAVTSGPGSYTGIRVGMSAAKGLCFSLSKPLILVNSLELLAWEMISSAKNKDENYYCPMIDARRSEVFTALYDHHLRPVIHPTAMILNEETLAEHRNKTLFAGNGSEKFKSFFPSLKQFINTNKPDHTMADLSQEMFVKKIFSSLVTSHPAYIKEFFDQK